MADEGIFATTAEVLRKAGARVSSVSSAEAYVNQYVADGESWINAVTGVNFSDLYAALNEDLRDVLKRWLVALAASDVIDYDTAGIGGREAETRLDFLDNQANKCQALLKDKIPTDFVRET